MAEQEQGLFSSLESFRGVTQLTGESKKLAELASQFAAIAKEVILGGCFEINGVRRIYPLAIEFYYHEEGEEGLKDPVMYHTNDHEGGKELAYYPLGSLNCHVSGIDVTFENEAKAYRASFLIRKYGMWNYEGGEWVEKKACEARSTYLYEDMFMHISLLDGITVKWIPAEPGNVSKEIAVKQRINVAAYQKDKNGKYEKICIAQADYDLLSKDEQEAYFSYSGKKLKKCMRMWNYSVCDK